MDINNDYDCNDPYANMYQTPKKVTVAYNNNNNKTNTNTNTNTKNESKNVFNPYEENTNTHTHTRTTSTQDELPKYVDLSKNAYAATEEGYEEEEPPLLEELGIFPENIKKKLKSVLTFHKIDKQILDDSDMAGPLLVFILFGISLVLQTKTHFGYIYGLSIFGSIAICILMNLMCNRESILLYSTISVLGYCMLPVVILSYISIFLSMKTLLGFIFCLVSIILSSYSATKFFEIVLSMNEQKWLIFYPVVLFYTCFVFLTIF